jgi:hypothetical protein
MTKFEIPVISSVRRNHALEHASINILSKKFPNDQILGHSDAGGFWLVTELSTEDVTGAVTEALDRLRDGDHELAYHPNCGTNMAVSGIAAALGAFVGMWGVGKRIRDKIERFPAVVLLATLALILTQPLGKQVQKKVSTDPVPGNLQVTQVTRTKLGSKTALRIATKG